MRWSVPQIVAAVAALCAATASALPSPPSPPSTFRIGAASVVFNEIWQLSTMTLGL